MHTDRHTEICKCTQLCISYTVGRTDGRGAAPSTPPRSNPALPLVGRCRSARFLGGMPSVTTPRPGEELPLPCRNRRAPRRPSWSHTALCACARRRGRARGARCTLGAVGGSRGLRLIPALPVRSRGSEENERQWRRSRREPLEERTAVRAAALRAVPLRAARTFSPISAPRFRRCAAARPSTGRGVNKGCGRVEPRAGGEGWVRGSIVREGELLDIKGRRRF